MTGSRALFWVNFIIKMWKICRSMIKMIFLFVTIFSSDSLIVEKSLVLAVFPRVPYHWALSEDANREGEAYTWFTSAYIFFPAFFFPSPSSIKKIIEGVRLILFHSFVHFFLFSLTAKAELDRSFFLFLFSFLKESVSSTF